MRMYMDKLLLSFNEEHFESHWWSVAQCDAATVTCPCFSHFPCVYTGMLEFYEHVP